MEEWEDFDKKVMLYIEYYLWLWDTLSFWRKEKTEDHLAEDPKECEKSFHVRFEGIYEQYSGAIKEKTEEEKTEDRLAEDSKKCEKSFEDFLEELQKIKSGDERNDLIGKMVADIQERLKEVDPDHNDYSGVFYHKDGKMINKKFDRQEKERQDGSAYGQ